MSALEEPCWVESNVHSLAWYHTNCRADTEWVSLFVLCLNWPYADHIVATSDACHRVKLLGSGLQWWWFSLCNFYVIVFGFFCGQYTRLLINGLKKEKEKKKEPGPPPKNGDLCYQGHLGVLYSYFQCVTHPIPFVSFPFPSFLCRLKTAWSLWGGSMRPRPLTDC